jgi:hypothetical protein
MKRALCFVAFVFVFSLNMSQANLRSIPDVSAPSLQSGTELMQRLVQDHKTQQAEQRRTSTQLQKKLLSRGRSGSTNFVFSLTPPQI